MTEPEKPLDGVALRSSVTVRVTDDGDTCLVSISDGRNSVVAAMQWDDAKALFQKGLDIARNRKPAEGRHRHVAARFEP